MDQKRLNFFFSLNNIKKTTKKSGIKQRLCWLKKLLPKKGNNYWIHTENINSSNKISFVRINCCYKNINTITFSF